MTRSIGNSIAALAMTLATGSSFAQKVDIAGIAFGDDIKSAASAVRTVNPKFKVHTSPDSSGKLDVVMASSWAGTDFDEAMTIKSDSEGRVWFIGRVQHVPQGKRYPAPRLVELLIEKYGKPSQQTPVPSASLWWHFDRSGHLYTGDRQKSPCAEVGMPGMGFNANQLLGTATVSPPIRLNPTCGYVIEAAYSVDGRDKLVDHWAVYAYNSAPVFDQRQRADAAKATANQQRIDAEIKAGNKPKL